MQQSLQFSFLGGIDAWIDGEIAAPGFGTKFTVLKNTFGGHIRKVGLCKRDVPDEQYMVGVDRVEFTGTGPDADQYNVRLLNSQADFAPGPDVDVRTSFGSATIDTTAWQGAVGFGVRL
jgi:hypothetical protein